MRLAFEAGRRQLEELVDRQHGEIKTHPQQQVEGIVTKLFRSKGHGFLRRLDDGREYYFHRNSVAQGEFDRMETGTGLAFTPAEGERDRGLQVSSVRMIDKPGGRTSPSEGKPAARPLGG